MPPDVLSITVRSMGMDGNPPWERTVYSWRKAWGIIDKACWPRQQTSVYKMNLTPGMPASREYGDWVIEFTNSC